MADNLRDSDDLLDLDVGVDEDRVLDLDADAAPDTVSVYDRPDRAAGSGISLMTIIVILVLLVLAYFVFTSLF